MDRKILIFLVGLMSLLFSSCEKDANIPVPHEDPKLVVYSYICPQDTVIQVSVTSSNSVFGNDNSENNLFTIIKNATVTVTTGGSSYDLVYDEQYSRYVISTSTVSVNPGQSYALKVSAPGFETVSASTTVPLDQDRQFTMSYHSMNPPNEQFNMPAMYRFNVSWKHLGENDYYRLSQNFYHVDTSVMFGSDTLLQERNTDFYSAAQASGGIISDITETDSDIYQDTYPYDFGFYYDLIVSTYDYYKFHESLSNYNPGDPFAEPTMVYSNMTNGYGIFAGYIRYTRRVDL